MRALVATSEKCDMYHTANSSILEASGKQSGVNIWRMPGVEGATAEKPVFTWYRLSVTSKSAAVELTPDGTIALKAGNNIFELSTRTGEDNLFMFDCILVTDDLSFNPQTDNWETIRDGDDGGDDTPGGDDHGDDNPCYRRYNCHCGDSPVFGSCDAQKETLIYIRQAIRGRRTLCSPPACFLIICNQTGQKVASEGKTPPLNLSGKCITIMYAGENVLTHRKANNLYFIKEKA